MIKMINRLLVSGILVLMMSTSVQAEVFKEGVDYTLAKTVMRTDEPSKVEVREFFWYGCPHCYKLEPYIAKWLSTKPADVAFVRTPGVLNRAWELHGKAFFAAKSLGVLEQTHDDLFAAIHIDKRELSSQKSLAEFYENYGVKKADFNKAFKSFGVSSDIRQADAMARAYRMMGVPTIVVNGKYITNGRMSKNYDRWIEIVDYLVKLER